jgi:hypothetical protein
MAFGCETRLGDGWLAGARSPRRSGFRHHGVLTKRARNVTRRCARLLPGISES